jgi:CRISPR-associated protein Csx14
MAEASIPVDLFNPGQVFACLGFLEAADVLLGDAEGGFDWMNDSDVKFRLRVKGENDPVKAVLKYLLTVEVRSLSPNPFELSTEKWGIPTDSLARCEPFPFVVPRSPATLPAKLIGEKVVPGQQARSIPLEYWGDSTGRDNIKLWAGAAGYPGAALARDALSLLRRFDLHGCSSLFDLSMPQSSSFRFDWRRDYIAVDVGFSINDHADVHVTGFPIVELLTAVGVSHARPERLDKLNYRYGVLGLVSSDQWFDPLFLRAALGCARLPFPRRTFSMRLGWPGKENQARCIVETIEEPRT